MRLKIVHTKNGKTLYKDLDTGHWLPKDKAEAFIKQNKISDVREPNKEEQIRKAQEQAKALNEQHTDPEPYKDILGPQEKNADPIERLTKCKQEYIINNKYRDKNEEYYKYHKNCALCTTAGVLQARGYDVEAMPRDKSHWRGPGHVLEVDYSNTDNYIIGDSTHWSTGSPRYDKYSKKVTFKKDHNDTLKTFTPDKEPQFMPKGAKAAAEAITEKVKGWGNGAVGELSVCWKDTNKWHSIMISNDHGSVFIFDAQDNTVTTEIEHFLKDTFAKRTTLVRLDNASLRQDCQNDLKKMVKPIDRSFGAAMKRLNNIPWEKIM